MGVCYAVSTDGIRWDRPELDLIEFNGSTCNNLVMRDVHGVGVTLDPHDPDPDRPLQGLHGGRHSQFARRPALVPYPALPRDRRPLGHPQQSLLGRTPRQSMSASPASLTDASAPSAAPKARTSKTWTRAVEVLRALPDEPDRQIYALIAFPHAQIYLGLLMMFDTATDLVDCELAWSRDTVQWERVSPGTPLIERGKAGSFDWGCVYAAAYPFLKDGRLQLYYGGSDGPHTDWRSAYLGLATLRPDGFAGLMPVSKTQTATLVTQPVRCSGRQLHLSADADSGQVRAALAAVDGKGLADSIPVQADVTDQPSAMARWSGLDRAGGPGNSAYLRTAGRDALFLLFQRLTPCLYSGQPAARAITRDARRLQRVNLATPPPNI